MSCRTETLSSIYKGMQISILYSQRLKWESPFGAIFSTSVAHIDVVEKIHLSGHIQILTLVYASDLAFLCLSFLSVKWQIMKW